MIKTFQYSQSNLGNNTSLRITSMLAWRKITPSLDTSIYNIKALTHQTRSAAGQSWAIAEHQTPLSVQYFPQRCPSSAPSALFWPNSACWIGGGAWQRKKNSDWQFNSAQEKRNKVRKVNKEQKSRGSETKTNFSHKIRLFFFSHELSSRNVLWWFVLLFTGAW